MDALVRVLHSLAVTMPQIELPLWFVTEQKAGAPPEHPPCDDSDAIIAFSALEKFTEYWALRKGGRYKVTLAVDRESLVVAIADVHSSGQPTICLDPKPDGTGGTQVYLADLVSMVG